MGDVWNLYRFGTVWMVLYQAIPPSQHRNSECVALCRVGSIEGLSNTHIVPNQQRKWHFTAFLVLFGGKTGPLTDGAVRARTGFVAQLKKRCVDLRGTRLTYPS